VAAFAIGKNTGMSVMKVKLVADLVRGKKVSDALNILRFLTSPVAAEVANLVKSAAANAENETGASDLRVAVIYASDGPRLKRFRPRARGRAGRVTRPSCRITVVVEE
jgi:large subunit ribosomal protein L22